MTIPITVNKDVISTNCFEKKKKRCLEDIWSVTTLFGFVGFQEILQSFL